MAVKQQRQHERLARDRRIAKLAQQVKQRARHGVNDGSVECQDYLYHCYVEDRATGSNVIFTRDTGYHSRGWWKNPEYERCMHLSLSFFDPATDYPLMLTQQTRVLTHLWIEALFGRWKKWLWCEPPYSDIGKQKGVWHYRLFCHPDWSPMKPRGEVYTKQFTERGWKSFSDVRDEIEQARQRELDMLRK